jgi:hypothetical protein
MFQHFSKKINFFSILQPRDHSGRRRSAAVQSTEHAPGPARARGWGTTHYSVRCPGELARGRGPSPGGELAWGRVAATGWRRGGSRAAAGWRRRGTGGAGERKEVRLGFRYGSKSCGWLHESQTLHVLTQNVHLASNTQQAEQAGFTRAESHETCQSIFPKN